MNKLQVIDWQHPFVDVFKYYNAFDESGHDKKGKIETLQDKEIARKIFRITGNPSAGNYIALPKAKSTIQTLGLNGRYLYIEFRSSNQFFNIHFDFTITGRNPVRFTLSNMFEAYKTTSSGTLQIPYPKENTKKWTILCIDIEHHLQNYGLFPKDAFKSFQKIYVLKGLQVCSDIEIRGVYTSDNLYNIKTLPKEMDFKIPKGKWEESYSFIYFPNELEAASKKREVKTPLQDETNLPEKVKKKSPSPKKSEKPQEEQKLSPVKSQPKSPEKPTVKAEERAKIPWLRSATDAVQNYVDQKESLLSLDHVIGFTGRLCPDLKWSQDPNNPDEVYFSAGNILVAYNTDTGLQRFFFGHDSLITSIDISRDGSLIASAQSDSNTCVKIWNSATGTLNRTIPVKILTEITSVSLSYNNKLLSVTGIDQYKRDTIIIYKIDSEDPKKVEIKAKHVSEFNILTCKFSPIELDKLVSCGKENIRFWRIKDSHITGGAVVLNHHARDTVFTTLEYDFNHENPATAFQTDTTRRVFIGSKSGLLFQVNYVSRELEGVFKIHDSCICALSVSQGFCVTGSEDQYLRVWPLDFSEYFLEAKHEGVVTSLNISHDGLKVVCGISSGGLGILDLSNQSYRTILRAHTEKIKQIEFHPFTNNLVSLSEDLTIRVWDSQKFEQLYEFTYSREDPCTGISCFPNGPFFAAGFSSGLVRVFDIENTCIIEEAKYHNTQVCCISYSNNGKYLITGDKLSNYNLFDVERNFQPVKVFEAEIENENPLALFAHDSRSLVTTGAYTNTLNIWDLIHFYKRGKITLKNATIRSVDFSIDDTNLSVLGNDGKIRVYGIKSQEATLLKEVSPYNKVFSNSLAISGNKRYLLTGCQDSRIRVWDLNNLPGDTRQVHPQAGHSSSVSCTIFSGDNTRVFTTAGEEGIFVWNFKGDLQQWIENNDLESFSRLSPIGDATPKRDKEVSQVASEVKETQKLADQIIDRNEEYKSPHFQELAKMTFSNTLPKATLNAEQAVGQLGQSQDDLERDLNSSFNKSKNPILRKVYKFKKLLPNTKPFNLAENGKIQKLRYLKNSFRENHKLPFKHYAIDNDSRQTEIKNKDIFRQRTNLSIKYHIGYNNDAHENVVWNSPGGWFAYGSENYLVIEQLTAERNQRLMNFSDLISCLALSKDGTVLAVGSSTYDSGLYASVHLIDCLSFKVIKTLKLHTKGIQSLTFSNDGKYLISIGNYRECTIAVWDVIEGGLVASSYTLTNINEVKIKLNAPGANLHFTTVGGDQIIQWILTNEDKLLHQETFIQPKNSKFIELTALNYVFVNERDYALIGTSEGEAILFDLSLNEIEFRRRLSSSEIVDVLTNNDSLVALLTSLDGNIYEWDYKEKLKIDDESNLKKIPLPCIPGSIYVEETQNEGLIGALDGGIYYCNFKENLFSKLVGTPPTENPVYKAISLTDGVFGTIHALGGFKLWNAHNGEELADYAYEKINCKSLLYQNTKKQIIAFYDDNTIKTIDFEDFSKVTHFIVDEQIIKSDEDPRFFVDSGFVNEQNYFYYFAVTNKGEVYTSELKERDEIEWVEVANQDYKGTLCHYNLSTKLQQFNLGFDDATIQTYKFNRGNEIYPEIQLIDEWNLMDDPHGDLDKNDVEKQATFTIYGTKVQRQYKVQSAFSETRAGIVFVSTNYLQYVIVRNCFHKEIIQRVPLNTFPSCLEIDLATKYLLVGLDDGWILFLNEYGEEIQTQRNYNDGYLVGLKTYKTEKNYQLLAVERKAFSIYNYQP